MAELHAVSREQHAGRRWRRYSSYAFAAGDMVAALVAQEFPKACLSLPIAFVAHDGGYTSVSVQGLSQGKNLWVAPDGRWLGGYVPASYRGYPFALATNQDGEQVLCVVQDSGLVVEAGDLAGEPTEAFFNDDGTPSKAVADVLNFLTEVARNRVQTQQVCALLQQHGLIKPWEVTLQTEQGQQAIQGLHCVDEQALGQASGEVLQALAAGGALPLAYCQLLSMQHLQRLGALLKQHQEYDATALPQTPSGELDLEFLNDNGSIRFS